MDEVEIININGEYIEVDKQCVGLVEFFNEIGLKTKMCCEGHNKPILRIWFDVEDDVMEEFIRKTGEWTEVSVRPNKERTKFEAVRARRGLRGWIYRRHWISPVGYKYYPEGYTSEWIYQAEGGTSEDTFRMARMDLRAMRAIYFNENLEEIQKAQQEGADIRVKKWNEENEIEKMNEQLEVIKEKREMLKQKQSD